MTLSQSKKSKKSITSQKKQNENIGITHKDNELKTGLTNFSLSDFFHDFSFSGEDLKFIKQELQKTVPLHVSEVVKYRAKLLNILPKINTIYDFFKNDYKKLLPENSQGEAFKEDILLRQNIGFDYVGIRNKLFQFDDGALVKGLLPDNIPITIKLANISRNYEIRPHPVKICGAYYNIPDAFKQTTGKTQFVLIIDASYLSIKGMRLKETLLNQYVGKYDPSEIYEFYILQNNENISDSAPKLNAVEPGEKNVKIYFLRDSIGSKNIYPPFSNKTQNSNLYTNIGLTTTKMQDGTINGEFKGDTSFARNNIGKISEINQASILALQQYIETDKKNDETMSYFLLKRAGDWCQALSLLDHTRNYDVYDEEHKKQGEKTLGALIKEGYTLGIVTHDRILLGYSLLLGLNVFYSMQIVSSQCKKAKKGENSITWLLNFQNIDNEINISGLDITLIKAKTMLSNISTYLENSKQRKESLFAYLNSMKINAKKDIVPYILDIRNILSFLQQMYGPEDFKNKEKEIKELISELEKYNLDKLSKEDEKTVSKKLASLRASINLLYIMNERNIAKIIDKYENYNNDKEMIELYINTLPKDLKVRGLDSEFDFFLETIKTEYNQLTSSNKTIIKEYLESIPREISNRAVKEPYGRSVMRIKNILAGGGLKELLEIQYRNDTQGNFYSIIDNCIFTKNTITYFKDALEHISTKTYEQCNTNERYIFIRFIIYYLDELYSELFGLRGEIQFENGKPQFEDDLYDKYASIYYQLSYIQESFIATKKIKEIKDVYFNDRYKWKQAQLHGELLKTMRDLKSTSSRLLSFIDNMKKIVKKLNKEIPESIKINICSKGILLPNESAVKGSNKTKRKRSSSQRKKGTKKHKTAKANNIYHH